MNYVLNKKRNSIKISTHKYDLLGRVRLFLKLLSVEIRGIP